MNLSKVEWAIVETMVIIFDKDNGETWTNSRFIDKM